jgi:acylphosphatase
MVATRILIRGRVQGVGFRFAMIDAAREAGVAGWVRNRFDGAVEALVQGDSSAALRMLDWCRRGPPGARVTEVVATDVPVDPALRDFIQCPSA